MSGLSRNQREALSALCTAGGDYPFMGFKSIAASCSLPPGLVRRTVRALARKGLAEYRRGLWTDEGTPAGSGYCATDAGRHLYWNEIAE